MNTGPGYDPSNVNPDDLAYLDSTYEAAKAQDPSEFEKVPDGDYAAKVTRVHFSRSKNGAPMLAWNFEVYRGTLAGRKVSKFTVVQDNTLGIIKSDLTLVGLGGIPLSKVPPHLEALAGVVVDLRVATTVNTKGTTYTNFYLQRVVGKAPAAQPEDDGIPF